MVRKHSEGKGRCVTAMAGGNRTGREGPTVAGKMGCSKEVGISGWRKKEILNGLAFLFTVHFRLLRLLKSVSHRRGTLEV